MLFIWHQILSVKGGELPNQITGLNVVLRRLREHNACIASVGFYKNIFIKLRVLVPYNMEGKNAIGSAL